MTTKTDAAVVKVNAEALLALGRLGHLNLASNEATRLLRADLPPGQHQGDVTFRLVYDMKVGKDHKSNVAQSVPWKAIAGVLFGKLNTATRDAVVRELLESAEGGGFQLRAGAVDTAAEAILVYLMGETRKTVAGKITGSAVLIPTD